MYIGKQCAGGRSVNRRAQILASNVLVEDTTLKECNFLASNALAEEATIEGHGYWQAMHWRKIRH
jgi:hypothetical protein